MPKKKHKKAAVKVTAPPPSTDDGDTTPVAPASASVESDAAPAPRHSLEADNEGGDVERLDE